MGLNVKVGQERVMKKGKSVRRPVRPYKWLAQHYDRFFTFGLGWAKAARGRILGDILPDVERACDLACGTGTTAVMLARKGIRMWGVDLSPGMCRAARVKARRAGVRLKVMQADMRFFHLPQRVDLVLCEYDALNHVPGKADLQQVVRSVARALRPGGHFYFDVNTRRAFDTYWGATWVLENPGAVLIMRNGHKGDRAWSNVDWFFRTGPLWRRKAERVEEVCWSDREVRQTLRVAGFDRIRAWDAKPFFKGNLPVKRGCRTFYLARKATLA